MTILDLNTLLTPITAEHPAGVDLRTETALTTLYYQIKDARNDARSIERQLLFKHAGDENITAKTHWQTVYQLAIDLLSHHSKDLEITVWLIEALIRKFGFAGLNEGLQLAQKLIEQYWEIIYPTIDEEGITTRLAPLYGLIGVENEGTLLAAIANVPLTTGAQAFTLWQYQQAQELETITHPKKREQKLAANVVELKDIYLAIKQTGGNFYLSLSDNLKNCITTLEMFDQELTKKCGDASPPSSKIRNKLNTYLECVTQIMANNIGNDYKPSLVMEEEAVQHPTIEEESTQSGFKPLPTSPSARNGFKPLPTYTNLERENALQTLSQIADFFRHTEIHSPIPYLLDRAIRWGRTPLPELLSELVRDEGLLKYDPSKGENPSP